MKLYEYIWGFARAYPLITIVSTFSTYFLTNNSDLLLLSGVLLIADYFNHFLKQYIFKPIMGSNVWGILGSGKRPNGPKNCGLFKDDSFSESYGMTSGTAQNAVFFSTYTILNLLDNKEIIFVKYFGVVLFIYVALFIMYSRIYLRCHTVQQVIVGGLIGAILGTLYYKNKDTIKNLIIM